MRTEAKRYSKADYARALRHKVKRTRKAETILTGQLSRDEIADMTLKRDKDRIKQAKSITELFPALVQAQPVWECLEDQHPQHAKTLLREVKHALLRHEYKGRMPGDWTDVAACISDILEAHKAKRKPKEHNISAEAKLLGVLVLNKGERRSIAWIAREAGVSRKTAYECAQFLSVYEHLYPKKSCKK